jgi:hypothetical protein
MSAWYSTTVHHVHGPHSASELKRLAARRLITPDALIGQTATGPWIAASRVRGLFPLPAAGQPPVIAQAPGMIPATLPARVTAWLWDGAVPHWKRTLAAAALAGSGSTALLVAGMGCLKLIRPTDPGPVALRVFLVALVLGMTFSAAQNLFIGIRGLVRRRPIVFSSRAVMWPVMAILALTGIGAVVLVGYAVLCMPRGSYPVTGLAAFLAQAAICLSLMYILWREATGYLAYGIDDEGFRNALVLALHRRGHAFRETITKIELLEPNVEIRSVVQPKIGTALLRTPHRCDAHLVAALAADMNEHYRLESETFNRGIFVLATIQGVAGILIVLPILMMLLS